MAFELNPLFHTVTMVKILQAQGHVQNAYRMALELLQKDSQNETLKTLVEQLKNPFWFRPLPKTEPALEGEDWQDVTEPGLNLEKNPLDTTDLTFYDGGEAEEKA